MSWSFPRLTLKKAQKAGLPPGSLVHIGKFTTDPVTLTCIQYNPHTATRQNGATLDDVLPDEFLPDRVYWINITGLHDPQLIRAVGDRFQIHPLVLEDIVDTTQQPKYEDLDQYLYLAIRMLSFNAEDNTIDSEQISMIQTGNVVLTFQERPGDVFDPIRDRIQNGKGKIRTRSADYLTYCLLDTIVDHYYLILEAQAQAIETLEDEVLDNPAPQVVQRIHHIKGNLLEMRKTCWAAHKVLQSLSKTAPRFFDHSTLIYLSDVCDHSAGVVESIETFREMITSLLDLYLSSVSHKMNSTMKVLTIIATIFIPLTFLAGIYGMNFEHMPELHWKWGYPAVWGVMAALTLVMLALFRKNRWF